MPYFASCSITGAGGSWTFILSALHGEKVKPPSDSGWGVWVWNCQERICLIFCRRTDFFFWGQEGIICSPLFVSSLAVPLIIIIIIIKALLHWNSIIKYGGFFFFPPAYLEKACLLQYHESLLWPHKGESALWNLNTAAEGDPAGGDVFSVRNETSRVRLSVTLTETSIPASVALEFSYGSHALAGHCGSRRK